MDDAAREPQSLKARPQANAGPRDGGRERPFDRDAVLLTATSFIVLFSTVGLAVWGLPFFYDFFVQQFGWTRSQVTSGNALSKLVVGPALGFFTGWMVDRFGPRRLMMAGVIMVSMALIGLGGISSLGMFYFFYLFNALGYLCGGPLPNQVLLSRRFDKSRGKAMGIAYLGIGLGGAVVPLISNALVQRLGWQAALQVLGVLVFAVAFPMAYFVKESPAKGPEGVATPEPPTKSVFRSGPFYLLVIGSMCSIAALNGTQQNLKLFLSLDQHYTQGAAARILSLVLAASIAGRVLMGWLADRYPKKYVMLFIYLLIAIAIPLLFLVEVPAAMYVFAVIFGIGLGGEYMIIPLMTAEIFGVRMLGRLMGAILAADGVAEAVSPWLIGRMRDATGSYSMGFIVLIGMAFMGAAVVAALPKSQRTALVCATSDG
jgi:MFS family permease